MRSEKGQGLLGFIVIVVILLGIAALIVHTRGNSNGPEPTDYVLRDEDGCFVPPQGDPLYDEHYSEINKNNCEALVDEATARNINADTSSKNSQTAQGWLGISVVGGVIVAVIALVVIMILKG